MIKLWNTLSGEKEIFAPIKKGNVGMYHCGPTVYNYAHIGNLRAYIFADTLRRMFKWNGFEVKQVINITDVGHLVSDSDTGEDKMEKGAEKEGLSVKDLAKRYTEAFWEDLHELNIKTRGTLFPKATNHIKEQIELIKILEEKGFTYKTSDGIYFDTQKFANYGKLGNINISGLMEGARVEANKEKKNPTDFALWKFFTGDGKREQEWGSPWGVGFPGWHIECSAMSMKYLGETFDIHTGGIDHIPVHHNNEIAQSEAGTGKPLAHFWMHSAFVNLQGGKMAKSENNFIRLKTLLDKGFSPLAYRYWVLTAHYKTEIDFSFEALEASQNALRNISHVLYECGNEEGKPDKNYLQKMSNFIEDDLDTPKVIALLWEMVKDKNINLGDKKATILAFDEVLGLDLLNLSKKIGEKYLETIPKEIEDLVIQRNRAREDKKWDEADEIREKMKELGFGITDENGESKIFKL